MTTTIAKLGRVRVELDRLVAHRFECPFTLAEQDHYETLTDRESDLLDLSDGRARRYHRGSRATDRPGFTPLTASWNGVWAPSSDSELVDSLDGPTPRRDRVSGD